jgi:16S rRNA (uracil1498-N3)-methyltransferase
LCDEIDNHFLPREVRGLIIPPMLRRVHLPSLSVGRTELPAPAARHLRDVLRLGQGDVVEAFDDSGATALARLDTTTPGRVSIEIDAIVAPATADFTWTVAVAAPKGPRADWMVEKLSELGTAAMIPLVTARSVSSPGGEKTDRWVRLAAEAARQSRRAGVMKIAPLTPLAEAVAEIGAGESGWYFSTRPDAVSVSGLTHAKPPRLLRLFIGPEGGWTEEEEMAFNAAGLTAVKLTNTVLRVETAAIVAAALAAVWAAGRG